MTKKIFNTEQEKERAMLFVVCFSNKTDVEYQMEELDSLAQTANVNVIIKKSQNIKQISPATLIGSGKVLEIKQLVQENSIDVVIFDCELSGTQNSNLAEIIGVKVIDRIALILDIFASRATTNEGKLQVALAQAKYLLPRLNQNYISNGKFGAGGVGSRGPGETKLETDKRAVEKNIAYLQNQIKKIEIQRNTKNENRKNLQKSNVAIVGYTNSGKSTLLNLITKANIYADDKLFATLETTSRSVWLGDDKKIILTDTVGFISNLPHNLIYAFRSTLDEAKQADLILHVIDASNKNRDEQIGVVNDVLRDLKVNVPIISVYNKCDKIHIVPKEDDMTICVSALKNLNIDKLKEKIVKVLNI